MTNVTAKPRGKRIRVMLAIGALTGGGSERQIVGILKGLDRSKFDPLLYLIYRRGELLPEVPDDVRIIAFDDDPIPRGCPVPGRMHRAYVRHMARHIRLEGIDLVYDRTWHMTMIAGGATRRAKVPRISVIVTDPERDFARSYEQYRRVKFHLLRRAYREADQVLTVSNGVRDAAAEFYSLDPSNIRAAWNFIDLERIDRLIAEVPREKLPSPADEFRIVAAGRLHEQKGFHFLLGAVRTLVHERKLRQLRVHILGEGEQEQELRNVIRQHTLEQFVTLYGFETNPAKWFVRSHLFCLSSIYEGMPNAVLEAMAARIPVLSTDCPSGPREVLDDGRVGRLVPAGDALALTDGIEDAIDNYSAWQAMIEPARQRIEDVFAPQPGIRRVEGIMEGVVSRSRSQP